MHGPEAVGHGARAHGGLVGGPCIRMRGERQVHEDPVHAARPDELRVDAREHLEREARTVRALEVGELVHEDRRRLRALAAALGRSPQQRIRGVLRRRARWNQCEQEQGQPAFARPPHGAPRNSVVNEPLTSAASDLIT